MCQHVMCQPSTTSRMDLSAINLGLLDTDHWPSDEKNVIQLRLTEKALLASEVELEMPEETHPQVAQTPVRPPPLKRRMMGQLRDVRSMCAKWKQESVVCNPNSIRCRVRTINFSFFGGHTFLCPAPRGPTKWLPGSLAHDMQTKQLTHSRGTVLQRASQNVEF